jgi:hypothetical protein
MDFTIPQEDPMTTTTAERDIVPVGTHQMEIKAAEEGTSEWKICDENPQGNVLKLRLSKVGGNYQFVWADIPQHLGWLARQLAEACGGGVAGGTVSLNPDDLVGRVIDAEISHYTKKSGEIKAVVKKYLPAKPSAASKPKAAAPRTQAAKVTADLDPDHIPF